jgi:hypothetical protein
MTVTVLDPVVPPIVPAGHPAPRLRTLTGTTVGVWSNRKMNTIELLDACAAVLAERHGVASFRRGTYDATRTMRPDEWVGLEGCDAVLLTHGD